MGPIYTVQWDIDLTEGDAQTGRFPIAMERQYPPVHAASCEFIEDSRGVFRPGRGDSVRADYPAWNELRFGAAE